MPGVVVERLVQIAVLASALAGLPLLGAWLAGLEPERFLALPPRPPRGTPGEVSVTWMIALAVIAALVLAPFIARIARAPVPSTAEPPGRFPWWGWLGLVVIATAWPLAWTRLAWLEPWQRHTFTPLWLGYILVVNAWCRRRRGHCPLTARPALYLALFPLSALCWWGYEYLNLFTGNWYYVGGGDKTAWAYVVSASIPFATVLPAVLATAHLLAGFPRLSAGLATAWRWPAMRRPATAWLMLAAGAAALTALPWRPGLLYPMVWLAPLLVVLGLQGLGGGSSPVTPIADGDWRRPWLLALAGLVCGIVWELWNAGSLAHWEYVIPKVHMLAVFEMPLLGYLGYLPFGLTCGALCELLAAPGHPVSPVSARRRPD